MQFDNSGSLHNISLHRQQPLGSYDQDRDLGRFEPGEDGREVVDLLNQADLTEDIGMSAHLPEGPSFEDDMALEEKPAVAAANPTSLPDVLYGAGGPLEGWDSPS